MTARIAASGIEKIVTVVEVALVDGTWTYTDLNFGLADTPTAPKPAEEGTAGAPGPPKKIAPFASPANGLAAVRLKKDSLRVYYVDVYGGIIELAVESGEVFYRNLTTELGASVVGRVSPLVVTEPGGLAIHYVDANDYLCRLWHDGGWNWHWYDEAPTVPPASALTAMVTTDLGRVFVYYLDARNHLVEVNWPRGKRAVVTDLSSGIGLPALSPVGPLTAVGFGTDSRRIYLLDVNDNVVEVAHTVGKPGTLWWDFTNLSVSSGAPVARQGSSLVARLTTRNHTRAYYDDTAGFTAEVENSGKAGWAPTTPGRLANSGAGAPSAADTSALAAVLSADDIRNYVFYLDDGGHLINLEWTGGRWQSRDLSEELGLPTAAHATPMSAVFDGGPRAYYLSSE
ncbi:hypothetical protein ACGFX2_34815 [Streptomyces goshikiensis]|uniref:hypothetical protein n=1 Tax=Streptomyces goshikiensis TaxID=1942 RepID=UPI00370FA7F6